MSDILPNRLPAPLSQRLSATSSALTNASGQEVDVALAGIPFLVATSQDLPQSIETIQQRKEQFDTEAEPGEQSIASSWWRRSQESFHEGAGNLYQESRLTGDPSSGFFDSRGVDVWTQGEFKLLRKMVEVTAASTGHSRIRTYTDSGVEKVSTVKGGDLYTGATPAALAQLHNPTSKTIVDGFVSGAYFYDLASDGTLYEGTTASPGTATNWPTASGATRLAYGHHRVWLIAGRKLFQPDLTLAGGTQQTAIFTHPNQGWNYTCLAEGPQAMYFGGHDGRTSAIQAVSLEADGGIPTLAGAQVVAALPDGELVQEIAVLAGQYIGIGTNRGFRVGVIDGVGITYGPLIITPAGVIRCSAIGTVGTFFQVAFDTTAQPSEAFKVDVSNDLGGGVFPYARDVECGSDHITSIAQWGDKVLATDDQGKVWEQHATDLVASGYLTTGRIRFRTQERKLFKYVELDTDQLFGTIQIVGFSENDTEFDIQTYFDPTHDSGTPLIPITSALGPQRHMALKFTLVPEPGDATKGPIIRSYLVRALPSSKPQRMITLPLLCFDREQSHSGMRYGYQGYAAERLAALQNIEDVGDAIIYQNYGLMDATGEVVVIDNMRFIQSAPGHPRENSSGRGGILVLQLRTVGV